MFCKGVYKLMTSTIDAYSSLYAHDDKNLKLELFNQGTQITVNRCCLLPLRHPASVTKSRTGTAALISEGLDQDEGYL